MLLKSGYRERPNHLQCMQPHPPYLFRFSRSRSNSAALRVFVASSMSPRCSFSSAGPWFCCQRVGATLAVAQFLKLPRSGKSFRQGRRPRSTPRHEGWGFSAECIQCGGGIRNIRLPDSLYSPRLIFLGVSASKNRSASRTANCAIAHWHPFAYARNWLGIEMRFCQRGGAEARRIKEGITMLQE